MKKVKCIKNFVIAETNEEERLDGKDNFEVYTKEEWSYGEGMRNPEFECGNINECLENIN